MAEINNRVCLAIIKNCVYCVVSYPFFCDDHLKNTSWNREIDNFNRWCKQSYSSHAYFVSYYCWQWILRILDTIHTHIFSTLSHCPFTKDSILIINNSQYSSTFSIDSFLNYLKFMNYCAYFAALKIEMS